MKKKNQRYVKIKAALGSLALAFPVSRILGYICQGLDTYFIQNSLFRIFHNTQNNWMKRKSDDMHGMREGGMIQKRYKNGKIFMVPSY